MSAYAGGWLADGSGLPVIDAAPARLDALEALTPGTVRNDLAGQPVNTAKILLAESTGTVGAALAALDADLTTPERAQIRQWRYADSDKLVSPVPGVYEWLAIFYGVNTGTAPITPLMARGRGNSVFTLSSSGRAYGKDPSIHGNETTAGFHPSAALVRTTNGDNVLRDVISTQDGSRFEIGMGISGTGIPGGATITGVSGRPGLPSTITISAPATATATGVAVLAQPTGIFEGIGHLLTGNCGTTSADLLAAAIQMQSQNAQSRWAQAINLGASALQTTGKAFRLSLLTAARALSVESSTLDEGVSFTSTSFTNAGVYFGPSVTGQYGIRFSSDGVYSIAALYMPGQSIGTDTTSGLTLLTSSTQKLGFFGRTPQVRPTLGVAAASDLATAIALVNAIRAALIQTGSGLGLVAA